MTTVRGAAPVSGQTPIADAPALMPVAASQADEADNAAALATAAIADTLSRAAKAADKAAQEARAKKYHIAIKEGGAITKPSEWEDLPDSAWGDPVNYRYPMKDKAHADNAAARWGDESNREQYSAAEQKVVADRIAARQKSFGEDDKKDDGERAASVTGVPGAELAGTLYAPFVRRDDGKWEVEGVLTSEDIDSYGTIFDYDSAKRAVADWAGNVREQHDIHKAVGRRVEYDCDDANRQVRLRVKVSKGAPDTWAKVLDGTLTGFSIGAYNARRENRTVNGRAVPVYKDYQYGEVSLVDAPSNPAAASSGLTICRVAGLTAPEGAETQWNDAVLERFEAAPESVETPETPETPEAAPVTPEPAVEQRAATPEMASLASLADAPSSSASAQAALAALESVVGPMSDEQRSQIANAAALMRGMAVPAAAAPVETPAPSPVETVTPEAAPDLTRASIDLASGAAFQGNDLASPANDPDAPKADAAMLNDTGHAHDTHTHGHATSYGGFHSHSHTHTHQDGTAHEHPHMHNHAHHEHYGDAGHSHAHAHVHDHSHEYRAAAPDLSVVSEPYPDGREAATTLAPSGDEQVVQQRAASHAAFTGSHSHSHAAFGSQGDDESHEHEHSHDGDADHHHSHSDASGEGGEGERAAAAPDLTAVITPAQPETEPVAPVAPVEALETLERAGQRISAGTRAALHQAALQIHRTCDCPTCQDAIALYDPDDDGDDDLDGPAGGDDPDGDGPMRARQGREVGREDARLLRLQQVQLTRATRKAVAAEVAREMSALSPILQQFRAIAARLTTVQASSGTTDANRAPSSDSVKSQLDEVRASLGAVQGLVEQIAQQPAPGGPILRAADKTLGMYAHAQTLDASAAPAIPSELTSEQLIAAVRQLQRSGALSQQDSQVSAAATILQQQMRGGR